MDLKPIMQFATDHQKTILMIYILILIVSALNFICIIVASKKARSFNPASPILAITNAFLAMASTLLLALCVLFLDTSKALLSRLRGTFANYNSDRRNWRNWNFRACLCGIALQKESITIFN